MESLEKKDMEIGVDRHRDEKLLGWLVHEGEDQPPVNAVAVLAIMPLLNHTPAQILLGRRGQAGEVRAAADVDRAPLGIGDVEGGVVVSHQNIIEALADAGQPRFGSGRGDGVFHRPADDLEFTHILGLEVVLDRALHHPAKGEQADGDRGAEEQRQP